MVNLEPTLFDLVASITVCVFVILGLATVVGYLLRRPVLEALAIGQIAIAATAGSALYIARTFDAPIWAFLVISLALLALGIVFLRTCVFRADVTHRPTEPIVWATVACIAGIILVHRLVTPEPQTGYSIFQSWVPQYIHASIEAGYFLRPEHMGFGHGYLSAHMLYPVDTRGMAALISYVFSLDAHAAYLGGSIASVIGSFSILAFGLRRSPWAVIGFSVMTLAFFRMAPAFKWSMSDNLGDHMMYLSGSAAMYYLVCGQAGRVARIGSLVAVAASIYARPSGAVYAAVFGMANGLRDLFAGVDRAKLIAWIVAGAAVLLMSAREIYLVLTTSIFAARPHDMSLSARNWAHNLAGTLNDWGIRPDPGIFPFGIPLFVFSALALLLWVYVWRRRLLRRPGVFWIILAPFLVLVGPLMTEVITGYRRDMTGSKIYILANFFLAWYPFWLVSRLRVFHCWPIPLRKLTAAAVLVSLIATPAAGLVFK